ncbi:Aegerolysin [Drechmeria coniospora]|uniref:Aegerolysin n=1 Tax=Drechmeria coniospora TaxID=98403 RepID=A0A151GNL8_DRECN|nr:Aegerolysin [Drechmeria coniospora]KYK58703.1 Aegerolysin [Drechmeria coniospora]ODA84068.1 hypothetical protein RJ55_02586 [Drechmeria coniospora]
MAYAQWIIVTIVNAIKPGKDIKVKNAELNWGKFWEGHDKDNEISATGVNSIVVAPGTIEMVKSCGRSDASSGTEGRFDLYDSNDKKICQVSWDCPWGSKSNSFDVHVDDSATYHVMNSSYIARSGAIGAVHIVIRDS